jgi:carbon starvation protein
VAAWGFFLYQGVTDPMGGVNTRPVFWHFQPDAGAIALLLATVVLLRMKQQRYAWVTVLPTVAADLHAQRRLAEADVGRSQGGLPGPCGQGAGLAGAGQTAGTRQEHGQMQQILFNDRVDAGCARCFGGGAPALAFAIRAGAQALAMISPACTRSPKSARCPPNDRLAFHPAPHGGPCVGWAIMTPMPSTWPSTTPRPRR